MRPVPDDHPATAIDTVLPKTPLEPAVWVEAVARSFGGGLQEIRALEDVTLFVDRGEAFAITGPSGSGKTTLLNLIAGLDRPSSGKIVVFGNDLGAMKEQALTAFRARSLGMVFQDSHLLPGLTALENVIAARLLWSPGWVLEPEARELLNAVGLGSRVNHPLARLSPGERQRVSVARALLGQPRLLIADEPTGNLDARSAKELVELLDRLRVEFGLTLLIATHDPVVGAVADRMITLHGGRVVAS